MRWHSTAVLFVLFFACQRSSSNQIDQKEIDFDKSSVNLDKRSKLDSLTTTLYKKIQIKIDKLSEFHYAGVALKDLLQYYYNNGGFPSDVMKAIYSFLQTGRIDDLPLLQWFKTSNNPEYNYIFTATAKLKASKLIPCQNSTDWCHDPQTINQYVGDFKRDLPWCTNMFCWFNPNAECRTSSTADIYSDTWNDYGPIAKCRSQQWFIDKLFHCPIASCESRRRSFDDKGLTGVKLSKRAKLIEMIKSTRRRSFTCGATLDCGDCGTGSSRNIETCQGMDLYGRFLCCSCTIEFSDGY